MPGFARRAASSAPVTEPIAIDRGQQAILAGPGVKHGDGHGRDEDREVEPERADQEQHQQDGFQIGPPPHVTEAFHQTAAAPRRLARFDAVRATRRNPSEPSTAANEAALIRNTQPVPTAAIRIPATAGPIMRAG